MAGLVLSGCAIKPFSQSLPIPTKRFITNPSNINLLHPKDPIFSPNFHGFSRWAVKVSAPLRIPSIDQQDLDLERERISSLDVQEEDKFDAGAPRHSNWLILGLLYQNVVG
ncbi:putative fatty acid desaturase [Helianthus annuus]|nr:putative fatty acid desaturase [Helianthus annuus]